MLFSIFHIIFAIYSVIPVTYYASSNGWSDDITAYANSKNTYITVGNILNNEIKGNGDGIRNINSKIDNSESSIVNQNNFTGNFKKIYSTT